MNLRISLALAACTVLGGCVIDGDDVDDRPARPGELGAGNFIYGCVGDADPLCEEGAVAETFPDRVAVGARFGLDFNPGRNVFDDGVALRLEAPNGSVVRTELGAYFIQRPGHHVFLAVTNDGEVVDVQHILAAEIERIAVRTPMSEDLEVITLEPGESITVSAVPQDGLRTTLAGSLDYTWSTLDPDIADVATIDEDYDVSLDAVDVGTTTLVVETAGVVREVEIEVLDIGGSTGGEGESGDAPGSSGAAQTGTEGSTGE